ncbi:DNA-binding protein [Pseudomonas sp. PSB1]|uniref:DNA-binding protein n=1 Tax=Pseudomonas sp. PSB1 TaxID=477819 RepID=UPI001660B638|nr:DNA-binding protein [Pseudomonas sp. PSB1]MBD0704377.1 plasmid replication region [Pseudomonas sp. PSB1]
MAIGVPETDVFAAADAVLTRGERPTVERVRLELGRGSPARVGGLLDQWWARLAERLNGETRLPTLPAEVSQAFVAVWQQAIHLAQGVAEQAVAEQRQVLTAECERVATVEDQARQDAAQYRQQAGEAVAGRQAAETRLADLELLLEQRAAQIQDLQQQRESLLRERGEAQQHSQTLQQELQELRRGAEQERAVQENYVRGVEDRAHREIDRAREEGKASAAKVKELGRHVEQLQRRLEATQAELSQAQQLAAAQQARGDTLEQQLLRPRRPTAKKASVSGQSAAKSKKGNTSV